MTFTEAATQVLRLVGKPLHYKEITDVAIEKDLLSHVGKSPEVTMGARLAAVVKKNEKGNPLVRVKPGVFALQEWDEDTISKGLADRTPALERLANQQAQGASARHGEPAGEGDAEGFEENPAIASPLSVIEEDEPIDEEVKTWLKMAASATEVFAAEDDDDRPIFGNDEEATAPEDRGEALGNKRRRRRRRRPGRVGEDDGLPSYTVSDVVSGADETTNGEEDSEPLQALPEPARVTREPLERSPRAARPDRPVRPERAARPDRPDRAERDDRFERRDRPERVERPERREPRLELEPEGDFSEDLAEIVEGLLRAQGRPTPLPLRQLAELAQRRKVDLGGAGAGALALACQADNVHRVAAGLSPRFRLENSRVSLNPWAWDASTAELERQVEQLLPKYAEAAERQLVRKLRELGPRAAGDLFSALLESLGFEDLTLVKRQNAHPAELHLSARPPGDTSRTRVAIVIRKDGRELGRERVIDLRGALHHYGPAQSGLLITGGQILSGARDEAAQGSASSIQLWDGAYLAKLCVDKGIGVTRRQISLPVVDAELFDALR